jgi:hypothetical protein
MVKNNKSTSIHPKNSGHKKVSCPESGCEYIGRPYDIKKSHYPSKHSGKSYQSSQSVLSSQTSKKYPNSTSVQKQPQRKIYKITKTVEKKRGPGISKTIFREGTHLTYAGLKFDAVSIEQNEASEPIKATNKLDIDPSDDSNLS